jgi:hypothetical protein
LISIKVKEMKLVFWLLLLGIIVPCDASLAETSNIGTPRSVINSVWLSGGGNEKSLTWSIGLRRDWLGLEIGIASYGNMPKTETFDIPHNNYRRIGLREGLRIGIDLLAFVPIDKQFSIYTGPGVYFKEEANIIQSNATRWFYKESSTFKTELAGQVGINYSPDALKGFTLGAGYHTLRGTNVQIGWMRRMP